MALESRPLKDRFACEVLGLRLWEPLGEETAHQLRDLWARHPVLVFRRQALSEQELAQFSTHFGPLERVVRAEWASPAVPEIGLRNAGGPACAPRCARSGTNEAADAVIINSAAISWRARN